MLVWKKDRLPWPFFLSFWISFRSYGGVLVSGVSGTGSILTDDELYLHLYNTLSPRNNANWKEPLQCCAGDFL